MPLDLSTARGLTDSRDTILDVVCAINQYDQFESWLPSHGWEPIDEITDEALDRALDVYLAYEPTSEPQLPGLEVAA